jgi:outer membrane protein assembly factor BamB
MRQLKWSIGFFLLMSVGCADHDAAVLPSADVADKAPPVAELVTSSHGSDWPVFLGPTRDSKSSETGIITDWPPAGPPIVWQKELGTGYGIGTISHGRYFHFDRWNDTARVTCLNAATGEEVWRFEYPTNYEDTLGYNNGPRCSPVVDGERLFVYGAGGNLHCLDVSDGSLIWRFDTFEEFNVVQNFFGVGSSPVVSGDLLICMVGGSPPGSPDLYDSGGNVTGNGSGIVAFDKSTGKVKYKITDELASYASLQLATIDGRAWCFAFCRGGLVGFEPQSGQVDFHYPWRSRLLESVNASMPVVVGNEVFISETYQIGSSLLAVRPQGVEVVWKDSTKVREKAMKTHWNTAVYHDGYLYGCSGRNPPDADLRCIEWKTGKVMWVERQPPLSRERSSLMYVDGHFVCLGEYGSLRLLKANPNKYEEVAQVTLTRKEPDFGDSALFGPQPRLRPLLRYPAWAAPILSHGLLYLRGDDRLVCLELIPRSSVDSP